MVWLDVKHPKPFGCQVFDDLGYQFGGFTLGNHTSLHEGFGILPADPMKERHVLSVKVHLQWLHAFAKALLVLGKPISVLQELMLRSAQLPRFESSPRRVDCERAFRTNTDISRSELTASKFLQQTEFLERIIESGLVKDMSRESIWEA